jgi:hypothetical protein
VGTETGLASKLSERHWLVPVVVQVVAGASHGDVPSFGAVPRRRVVGDQRLECAHDGDEGFVGLERHARLREQPMHVAERADDRLVLDDDLGASGCSIGIDAQICPCRSSIDVEDLVGVATLSCAFPGVRTSGADHERAAGGCDVPFPFELKGRRAGLYERDRQCVVAMQCVAVADKGGMERFDARELVDAPKTGSLGIDVVGVR